MTGLIVSVWCRDMTIINRGTEPLTIYLPNGGAVSVQPGASYPPPPGVYWTRTGGKTWRVEIVRALRDEHA